MDTDIYGSIGVG